jgi:hypothetical protein
MAQTFVHMRIAVALVQNSRLLVSPRVQLPVDTSARACANVLGWARNQSSRNQRWDRFVQEGIRGQVFVQLAVVLQHGWTGTTLNHIGSKFTRVGASVAAHSPCAAHVGAKCANRWTLMHGSRPMVVLVAVHAGPKSSAPLGSSPSVGRHASHASRKTSPPTSRPASAPGSQVEEPKGKLRTHHYRIPGLAGAASGVLVDLPACCF